MTNHKHSVKTRGPPLPSLGTPHRRGHAPCHLSRTRRPGHPGLGRLPHASPLSGPLSRLRGPGRHSRHEAGRRVREAERARLRGGAERPTFDGEGRWQQFTNGQIVTTPAIGMVVAVYRESVSCADRLVVEWKVRGFSYDEFWVRIDQDREEKRCPAGACTVDVVATSPSQGTAVRPL